MTSKDLDLQYLYKPSEDTEDFKMKPRRFLQPTSHLHNYALCLICVGLLLVIMVLAIYRGSGEKLPDQSLEHWMQNISYNIHRKLDQLAQDGSSVMERLRRLEESLTAFRTNPITGDLQSSLGATRIALTRFSEQANKLSCVGVCPEGWTLFSSSCYFHATSRKSWNQSDSSCQEKEAHLATIGSEEEQTFLAGFLKSDTAWIGLTDHSGDWKWVDETSYETSPKFWEVGQPDNWNQHDMGGGEDCAQLRKPGEWNDGHCTLIFPFICEQELQG